MVSATESETHFAVIFKLGTAEGPARQNSAKAVDASRSEGRLATTMECSVRVAKPVGSGLAGQIITFFDTHCSLSSVASFTLGSVRAIGDPTRLEVEGCQFGAGGNRDRRCRR